MSSVLRIGAYQLRNLLENRVKFHYIDLRPAERRRAEAPGHELLADSVNVMATDVLIWLREHGAEFDAPVVLICENGVNSMAVAERLAQDSFINVFIVEGGTEALNLS